MAAFARHMREQQGLASPTLERYTIAAQKFLENRFGDAAVGMRSVVASDIIDFIRGQRRAAGDADSHLLWNDGGLSGSAW